MAPRGFSLYSDTLPPVTGVSKRAHASPMPRSDSESWWYTSGLSGFPKFRLSVTARGRAPEQTRLRAASATAIWPPRYGFRYT